MRRKLAARCCLRPEPSKQVKGRSSKKQGIRRTEQVGSIGDLDRVHRWHRVFGMVNSAPGFIQQPQVINGFSDLILELYGPERGAHTRSAVGMAELPFNIPVEIEGELSLRP